MCTPIYGVYDHNDHHYMLMKLLIITEDLKLLVYTLFYHICTIQMHALLTLHLTDLVNEIK